MIADGEAAGGLALLLERVYADCHRIELIDPDPLIVVRTYGRAADAELVALFCAALALGRARSIADAARRCLAPFGAEPAAAVAEWGPARTRERLGIDAYRFFSRRDLAALLSGLASLQSLHGSLEAAFVSAPLEGGEAPDPPRRGRAAPYADPSGRLLSSCDAFVSRVLDAARSAARAADSRSAAGAAPGPLPAEAEGGVPLARNLLPAPRDGSACKRLMLFLRWMVRRDDVDLGLWTCADPAELVIPLDTHVHRIALRLGLTRRPSADLAAALETTASLRAIDPADPVRFDFSLARLGIRSDYSLKNYLHT